MRNLRSLPLVLSLSALAAAGVAACGTRTELPDQWNESSRGSGGDGGATSASSTATSATVSATTTTTTSTTTSTSTGMGGGLMNPIISDTPGSLLQAETHVAAGTNGFVAVAWIDVDQSSSSSSIGYAISTDNGASFSPVQFLTTPLMGQAQASDPVLAIDAANNFYLSWVGYLPPTPQSQNQPTNMHVYVAKAASGAVSFGAPVEASNPVSPLELHDKPWIMVDNTGSILVTYASATQNDTKLHAARSTDGGSTWQHALIAQDQAAFRNLAFPCAPKKGDRIWVTYISIDTATGANVRVGLSWSDDHGATWAPLKQNTIVNEPNDPVAFDDPNCVAEGNDVWISYGLSKDPAGETDAPASFAIKLAHSGDGGKTIDSRLDAHDPAAAPLFQHPQIAREVTGAIDLVYYAGQADQDPDGSYRRSRWSGLPGSGFTPSVPVEAPVDFIQARSSLQWLGDYSGIFTLNGVVHMSYVTNASGTSHIAYAAAKVP